MKNLYLLLIIILAIGAQAASMQSNIQAQLKFKSLTINDGLSNNHVNSICQDAHGFMWFATYGGLTRYDGYNFTFFQFDPEDTLSISNNAINKLYEDARGDFWIGTLEVD